MTQAIISKEFERRDKERAAMNPFCYRIWWQVLLIWHLYKMVYRLY